MRRNSYVNSLLQQCATTCPTTEQGFCKVFDYAMYVPTQIPTSAPSEYLHAYVKVAMAQSFTTTLTPVQFNTNLDAKNAFITIMEAKLGSCALLLTTYISPDWQSHPKSLVAYIALASLLFNIAHLGCMTSTTSVIGSALPAVDWYLVTYFSRVLLRLLVSIVASADLLIHWTKGCSAASRITTYTILGSLLISAVSTIIFAGMDTRNDYGMYGHCWYRYGNTQIYFEMSMLSLCLVFKIGVLAWVSSRSPTTEAALSDSDEVSVTRTENNLNELKSHSSLHISDVSCDIDQSTDKYTGDPTKLARKCGVSGDYIYRLKLVVGFFLAGTIFQILLSYPLLNMWNSG